MILIPYQKKEVIKYQARFYLTSIQRKESRFPIKIYVQHSPFLYQSIIYILVKDLFPY